MAASQVDGAVRDLGDLYGGRVAIRVFDPREIRAVRRGRELVPVQMRHGAFVRSFERLVVSYGTPLYGTIDPTPVVAVFFVLLFALMFGDLGQGAVILALGWVLAGGRIKAVRRWKGLAPILKAVGGASMFTGLLYGSVFSEDTLLVRPTRWLTGLFGQPMDRLVAVLPTDGFGRFLAFFAFTLGVGVLLNSLGLVINIYNRWRLGQYERAFFGKTGLAGAVFFWYGLFFALRLVLGGTAVWADALGLGLPLLSMALGPGLLDRWRQARRGLDDGDEEAADGAAGAEQAIGVVSFLVEIIEILAYYLSNTVSFLRVGAFALAHAVLSLSVFTLSDLVGGVAGGPLWSFIVILIGNLVILVLEGMIVAIQVTRLHYYEFFSKFLTETGQEFRPFSFQYKGGGT
jgi:V/A-type H+-transporting ATPase subunit I